VHFLLLQGAPDPLAAFYPSLTPAAASPTSAYPVFRTFCIAHATAIRHLLTTRRVQTNEVGRCAYLFPAFALVARLADERPLGLIEIGTSAGLNLLWDQYGYQYGQDAVYGDPHSAVQITCTLRGANRPPFPHRMPQVARRVGVDLHVVDLGNADEVLWLQALVLPEHRERAQMLRHAIELTRHNPPQLLSGDGLVGLPDLLHTMPEEVAVCAFHTHTLNQWSVEARDGFATLLAEYGATRELYRISAEGLGRAYPHLELTAWHQGQADQRLLGYCHHHGQWLEWLDRSMGKDA